MSAYTNSRPGEGEQRETRRGRRRRGGEGLYSERQCCGTGSATESDSLEVQHKVRDRGRVDQMQMNVDIPNLLNA